MLAFMPVFSRDGLVAFPKSETLIDNPCHCMIKRIHALSYIAAMIITTQAAIHDAAAQRPAMRRMYFSGILLPKTHDSHTCRIQELDP
jgi:hypothetical protein